ncbi:MAG: flagellar hook-length control protein FliK [Desulfobacteraceae bacterium]|nr:MAG: flagellar hook-length control protein FliK [Desulfobacteraceae bacterium]
MISQGIKLEQLLNDFLSIKAGRGTGSNNTRSFDEIFEKQLTGSKENNLLSPSSFFSSINGTSGKDFLENIKKFLQGLGLKSEQVYAGKESLAWLQKMLLKHDFDPEEIQNLFDSFQTASDGHKVKLSDLFAKLSGLHEKEEEEGSILMPSSAVPFFQAILPVLGLDEQTVESALSYAKAQGGNIHTERLISFLKGLGALNSESGADKQLPDTVSQMMKSLGIPISAGPETRLSLPQFVSRLEMMLHEKAGKSTSGTQQKKEWLEFLNSLTMAPVFSNNHALTEKLTRLKSTNPLEASKSDANGKHSLFSNTRSMQPASYDSDRSGQNLYQAMNRESHFTGKDIQSLLNETSDQNDRQLLKSSMQETMEQAIHKQGAAKEMDSGMESNPLIDMKRDIHSVAGSKTIGDKPLPSYVLNQVSKQIIRSFQDGLSEIRLQLKPPHLGRLQIHMKTINDVLKVSIIAENNTTQKMLKTHSDELKAALLEHGIRLEKIDVQISFNFDQSMSQAKQDSRKSPDHKEQVFNMDGLSETVGIPSIAHLDPLTGNAAGTLDLIA